MDLAELVAAIQKGLVTIDPNQIIDPGKASPLTIILLPPPEPPDEVAQLMLTWSKESAGLAELEALTDLANRFRDLLKQHDAAAGGGVIATP